MKGNVIVDERRNEMVRVIKADVTADGQLLMHGSGDGFQICEQQLTRRDKFVISTFVNQDIVVHGFAGRFQEFGGIVRGSRLHRSQVIHKGLLAPG